MPPSLSLIIPSHNRPDLLRRCLASVRRHAPPDTEVLVVDDGSAGGTVSAAAADFVGVRCVRLPRQHGFCVAANTGLRTATRPLVELLNDDTEVTEGWTDAALAHFDDARVAAVAPLVLCGSPEQGGEPRIDSAGDRYFVGGIAGKRGHGQALTRDYLHARPVFGASASSAFYRRDVVLTVGGFPEQFGAYFEDVDLSFRLHWAGYRIEYEPAARVWHLGAGSHGRPDRRLLAQQSRNEELVFWRNLPAGRLFQALPLHLAVLAAKAWRRWRHGELLPFLAGRLQALGQFGAALRHRQQLCRLLTATEEPHWELEERYWS